MKRAIFHPRAREAIREFPEDIRGELGKAIYLLQAGEILAMPLSRNMPSIAPGVGELRVRGVDGAYRLFYFCKSERGILIFHAFVKKSEKTSQLEIVLGRKRLKELQYGKE